MSIDLVIYFVLAVAGIWFGIAFFVGAVRYVYRPLLLGGIGTLLIGVSCLMRIIHLQNPSLVLAIGLLCSSIFGIVYRKDMESRGITPRKIFLFSK